MKNINQIIGNLPAKRRARVTARAQQLIGEEMALHSSSRKKPAAAR